MNFILGLLAGLALGSKKENRKTGGIWLETRGSHETNPFEKMDAREHQMQGKGCASSNGAPKANNQQDESESES